MKTKRFLALLLALLISLSTLFGCIDFKDDGGYDSSHSEDANDENSPSSPSDDGNSSDTGTTKPSDNTDSSHGGIDGPDQSDTQTSSDPLESISISEIPEFDGKTPFVVINGNRPFFTSTEKTSISFEKYSALDELGRCGVTVASVGVDIMPTENRESISSVTPTGWINARYDIVDGSYLYNRCHLIGFQLTGENANKENLITGTRFMNVDGMLPFENMVADYVKETENHVMYRVTPIFEGSNLVASGVLMEAVSVEDNGKGIEFCVYVYNCQPGIIIDYRTGESRLDTAQNPPIDTPDENEGENEENNAENESNGGENVDTGTLVLYIVNTNTGKFHLESCRYVKQIKDSNRKDMTVPREDLIEDGYSPCKNCNP